MNHGDAEAWRVADRYLTALGGDDPDAVADLVADDFVNEHQNALGAGCSGRDEYRRRLGGFFADFPRRRYEVVDRVVASGTVVVRYRFVARATHATGEPVEIDIAGVMWIDTADGEVTRRIDTWDALSFLRQVGAAPDG